MKILAFIPARTGSRGVPGKNIRPLAGKPLIAWTIELARSSDLFAEVLVSTDGDNIAQVARRFGAWVPFLRDKSLAGDDCQITDVLLDLVQWLEDKSHDFDVICMLQPTSPLRAFEDIEGAITKFKSDSEIPLASISALPQKPTWLRTLDTQSQKMQALFNRSNSQLTLPRQSVEDIYYLNGAVYLFKCDYLKTHHTLFAQIMNYYVMPIERSVDIDTEHDFHIADLLMQSHLGLKMRH